MDTTSVKWVEKEEFAVERSQLKKSTIRGVVINFGSQTIKFGIQFLYQVLIMRVLAPADFGLLAMAAPVLAFVQLFSDFGLSQAVIQRKDVNQQQLSFLFWLNAGFGASISLLTIACAPLVAHFYGDDRLTRVMVALGSLLFFSALQSQYFAVLNRRMAFGRISAIGVASTAIGGAIGIAAAHAGAGYWSLVFNQVGLTLSSLVMVFFVTRWIPDAPRKTQNVKELLKFGGDVTGFNILNFFARNLDNVLIGRAWGDVPLGLYDRAYKLLLLPLSQVVGPFATVALPALSRTLHEPAAYKNAFLRMLDAVLLLTYPGIIFAMMTSAELIDAVFGHRWDAVAPIFRILAIGGLMAPISNATSWLFTSQGRTSEMRNWGIVSSALFVMSFAIGLHWGPIGVASCYIGVGMIQGPMLWWASTRTGPVRLQDVLHAMLPYLVAGAMLVAALSLVLSARPSLNLPVLCAWLVASYLFYVSVLWFFPSTNILLCQVIRQFSKLSFAR
jgi:polysaccharide transporter, PST family